MRAVIAVLRSIRDAVRPAINLVGHQLMGTVGVVVLAAFMTFSFCSLAGQWSSWFSSRRASWMLTEVPGFPVQILVGINAGVLLGRHLGGRASRWVWVLPTVSLCLAMYSFRVRVWSVILHAGTESVFSYFFGYGCRVSDRCFDQLLTTLPFLSSSGYAVGTIVAEKFRNRG
jgi:hypothetical protein